MNTERANMSTNISTAIESPESIWQAFLETHWEKSHAFIPNAANFLALPVIEPEELFDAVVACTDEYGRGKGQITRLYINNIEINVLRDKKQWLLPQREDQSFEGYHDRMLDLTGTSDYSLIVTDWHQFDRSIWEKIISSVAEISRHVGISASRIDTQLFLGTYKRTPFGVHVDATSAFHFPVIGSKTMRFWTDQFASNNPKLHHASRYDEYLDASTEVTANPGDVIYWPSDYWHVGEGDGNLSVTWRFAYWVADGFRQFAARRVAEFLRETTDSSHTIFSSSTEGGLIDIGIIESVISQVSEIATRDDYRDELVRVMLEQVSAYGFLRLPAILDRSALLGQPFYRKDPFKFFAAPLSANRICISAAGCSITLEHNVSIEQIIGSLNRKTEFNWLELMIEGDNQSAILEQIIELGFISGALKY